MVATVGFSLVQMQMFFAVLVRVAAILMSIPIFSGRNIPTVLKAGFVLAVSLVLYPLVQVEPASAAAATPLFIIGVAGEILLGVAVGLIVRAIFAGVQLAGQLAGYQMGMAIANVIDPDSSDQIPLISQFYQVLAVLIFVTVNAHYWFLGAMQESFRLVPPYGFQLSHSLMHQLIELGSGIFIIGLKIGAPVMVVLLLTSVAFGLIARTVPQMNIFIVAIPLKIAVGFLFIFFSLPYCTAYLTSLFGELGGRILTMLAAMK
jgi:flagellar biosynthetic protein FliR